MDWAAYGYPVLVWIHLLLFVLWLGADVGVFLLGQHFRKRAVYSLEQRLALLKLLVVVDLVPRVAWALMVPVSLSLLRAGGWWELPLPLLGIAWTIGLLWTWLILDSHRHAQTSRATRNGRIETGLKLALTAFYLWLGLQSLLTGWPLMPGWLAIKAMLFGLIFVAAIMIDVRFKPVAPQLARLLDEGSSDATESPLRRTMDRARRWVWAVYSLLLVTSFLGSVKPI